VWESSHRTGSVEQTQLNGKAGSFPIGQSVSLKKTQVKSQATLPQEWHSPMVVKILVLHFIESSKETPRRLPWKNTAGHSNSVEQEGR
jgi:hypothetical protein